MKLNHLLTSAATALVLGTSIMGTTANAQSDAALGDVTVTVDDFYASDLMGMRVYSSDRELGDSGTMIDFENDAWDDIGEINDLIVNEDGTVRAAVVGVGGFLGIGEKDVAVSMDMIRVYDDENEDRFLVISSSAEALEAAPAFELPEREDTAVMTDDTTTDVATTDMATDDAMADDEMMTEGGAMTEAENEEAVQDEPTSPADVPRSETNAESEAATDEAVENLEESNDTVVDDVAEGETLEEGAAIAESDDAVVDDTTTDTGSPDVGGMEREGYTPVMIADLTADDVTGSSVYGYDDENLGTVSELVVGADGVISDAIIDFGGFLGIGQKSVAVSFDDLELLTDESGDDLRIYYAATREELEAMPDYEG